MNYAIVFRLLALIHLALALAFSASFGVGFIFPLDANEESAVRGLEVAAGIALVLSVVFYLLGRKGKREIFHKEALAVIGLGWLSASVMGAIPYYVSIESVSVADAFFESASGFTTTGASIFSDVSGLPHALLFWRSLTQWIGGLGVVVFFVAILSFLGSGAKVLFSREYSGNSNDLSDGRMQTGALRIMLLYLVISAMCAVAYRIAGMDWFDAVCHMFTTVSTGGFGTRTESLAAFQSPATEWVAIVFMALCGSSFLLVLRSLQRRRAGVFLENAEFVRYAGILVSSIVLVVSILWITEGADSAHDLVRGAVFQVISIMTTTGFATENFAAWAHPAQIVLLVLMVVGGCSGSTAGGVKVIRVATGFRAVVAHLERSFRPHVVRPVRVNRKVVSHKEVEDVSIFLVLALFVVVGSFLLVSLFEPSADLVTSFSAVLACLFNIGPGLGEVGPNSNFSAFHDQTKILLALLMIMGRLEFYAILALFAPSLWRRFR